VVICSCQAVNDRAVREAIASGARTVDDLTARCGAAGDCGGCRPELERILAIHTRALVPAH
jgi:bacterioferritin-associated ferredoxin